MPNRILYRALTQADFPAFKKLINNAWHTDSFIKSPAILDAALDAYMRLCLFSATFAYAAVHTDETSSGSGGLVGIIAGRANGKKPVFSRMRNSLHVMRDVCIVLRAVRTDRAAVIGLLDEFSQDRQLIYGKKKRYGGQIIFFAVDSAARGIGIGSTLLEHMYAYFRHCRVNRFYLFTDSWCNYQFYDRHGFTQTSRLVLPPDPRQCGENCMYLYEKDI